jgi:gas vesicle protein
MNRILSMMAGLLLGAALAIGLVLLFAPKSGAEMRRQIQERVQDIMAEGRQAAEVRRLELTTQFESLKQPVSES